MPYKIKHSGSGYKVTSPNHPHGFSKKSISKKKAKKQLAAIHANSNESISNFDAILAEVLDRVIR